MNAGIADAMDLSWMLAAVLKGWAPESLLDAYERERQPITEQVQFAMEMALNKYTSAKGHAAGSRKEDRRATPRAPASAEAYDLNVLNIAAAD
jgi:2-polyprenyl-6-methoxyphenol hydroxylase-like FAD-dependent oxidoreductase